LNGILGKQFKCKRGVWQGKPLSPLLFVLSVDLLHYVLNAKAFTTRKTPTSYAKNDVSRHKPRLRTQLLRKRFVINRAPQTAEDHVWLEDQWMVASLYDE
jgi:hypothetical protein